MTVHVLHAGDGYTYLTRQVASHDAQRRRGESLSDYYVHDGNPPGRWVGEGIGRLGVGGEVTEEQMKALFGEGRHPDSDRIERALVAGGASVDDAMRATQLGRKFPEFKQPEDDGFAGFLADGHKAFSLEHGRAPRPGSERDELRRSAASKALMAQGKSAEEADVARYLAGAGSVRKQPVAGYDLVFTPVKSVSVLWGLGDAETQRQVAEAHEAAWRGTMAWLESEAAVTRVGAGGVAQVDAHGLVATAFDHLDSRAGDPNLHTHLAVANKVQGLDGKWRALDGRVLHALGVSASERYNTMIEAELSQRLGVSFVDQPSGRDKRPVREIEGIPLELREEFSARRASIEEAFEATVAQYRAEHGHEPSKAAQYKMAQQATLATRQDKEEGVALSTRREQWRTRAVQVLGSPDAVDAIVSRERLAELGEQVVQVGDPAEFSVLQARVLTELEGSRAVWTVGHVQAEAQRVARSQVGLIDSERIGPLAEQLAAAVLAASVPLTPPDLNPAPAGMRRIDGESVYRQHATARYTSLGILDAEDRIVMAARTPSGYVVSGDRLEASIDAQKTVGGGRDLNEAQRELARRFACGGHLIEAGIGPAGAGKTSAMTAFAAAVQDSGGRVIGLAPSAASAAVLGGELGVRAETLHKVLHAHSVARSDDEVPDDLRIDERTFLLLDEAGMASTPELDAVVRLAASKGAAVRLLGDPAQLQAIGAGGVLRLIDEQVGATHLESVHRFLTPGEAEASLALREGDEAGLGFYIEGARTLGGTREAMIEEVYANWVADRRQDKTTLMIAASRHDVLALSVRARMDRVAGGEVERGGVRLHDDSTAGVGDLVVTRENDRRLRVERGTDYVKNGDIWTVVERGSDGSLRLRHRDHASFVTVPADYVEQYVELGYATTIHRAQGMTVDTAHYLVDAASTREQLYTGLTRGRQTNRAYVAVDELIDPDLHQQPTPAQAVDQCLRTVLARSDSAPSATATVYAEYERAASLATLVPQYEDVWERIVSVGAEDQLAEAVRAAVPGLAEQILQDEAWPSLRATLLRHQRAGGDLPALIADAAEHRELDSARSAAVVLQWRLGDPRVRGGRLPAWVTPALPSPVEPPVVVDEGLMVEDDPEPHELDDASAKVIAVNEAAWQLWTDPQPQDWVPDYLAQRGLDVQAGHAPAGWTSTIDALRAQGFTDDELAEAGIATLARNGNLIDRFRDRLVLPVRDQDDRIIAFTARSNPSEIHEGTPKYINSPETAAYTKGDRLLGLDREAVERLRAGATPVLVEGAMDRAALAQLGDQFVPLAPCGTAVTESQLDALREITPGGLERLIVALDGDEAGHQAAARVWKMLRPHEATEARHLDLPEGQDPADLIATGRADELRQLLNTTSPLTDLAIARELDGWDFQYVEHQVGAIRDVAELVAPLPASAVAQAATDLRAKLGDLAPESLFDTFLNAHLDAQSARMPDPSEMQQVLDSARDDAGTERPLRELIDEGVTSWLDGQAALIAQRLDALVAQVEYAPPTWAAASIQPIPEDESAAQAWRQDVRKIVAYRDRWDVTSSDPLPAAGVRGTQETARTDAEVALHRVAVRTGDVRQGSAGAERAHRAAQTQRCLRDARTCREQQDSQTLAQRVAKLTEGRAEATTTGDSAAERIARLRAQQEASTDDQAPPSATEGTIRTDPRL